MITELHRLAFSYACLVLLYPNKCSALLTRVLVVVFFQNTKKKYDTLLSLVANLETKVRLSYVT